MSHPLQAPSGADFRASLGALMGHRDADRFLAAALTDIERPGAAVETLTPDELLTLCRSAARRPGLASVIARSFIIRLRSFTELSTRPESHDG